MIKQTTLHDVMLDSLQDSLISSVKHDSDFRFSFIELVARRLKIKKLNKQ